MDANAPVLELRGASIGYDGRSVVSDVDLTVTRGEVVAVVGANGSGKSTLLRGVLGLANIVAGHIDVLGEPVNHLRDQWRVGYVPQRDSIAGGVPATVREVVASGRLPRIKPWRRASALDRMRVDAAIKTVGLTGNEHKAVVKLSGGQQRRVLVARALAADAELLLLDEPTAGVDAENQQMLADTLAELARLGTTIILVTHELGPAAAVVTRVVAMRDGRVAYDGAADGAPRDDYGLDHHHHAHEFPRRGQIGLTG